MTIFTKILAGSAGVAMLAGMAAPAAAQYNPYPNQYPSQGYGQGGVVGQIINNVLGQGRYGAYGQGPDRIGVDQCARAAEARVSGDLSAGRYGAYNQGYHDNRYSNGGYNNAAINARVVGITQVERRNNGLRVRGVIDTGMGYNQGYDPRYGQQGYDPRYGQQGYDPRYADPRYNPGYGQPGYGNRAYGYDAQRADLRFDCRVDYRGRVLSLEIKRNYRRGG